MQPVYIQRIASIHPQGKRDDSRPYLQACEPDYKNIITNPTLRRRMSRIVKMGVACGLECIGGLPSEEIQGIITATGLGCLVDTEKFLNTLIDNEERMLNPTPFIQSTFNTIGAQIALIRGIHAYNMTYVHRGLSFESALLDAMMKIWEGSGHILIGAMDEMTDTSHTIQQRLGILKGIEAGEGAQFFLLSREAGEHPLAEIKGIETFAGQQTTEEIENRIMRFLQRNGLNSRDIQWFMTGKNKQLSRLFPESIHLSFKDECGEYPTASSYAVWKVVKESENCTTPTNILIYNHNHSINHSLILIRKSV